MNENGCILLYVKVLTKANLEKNAIIHTLLHSFVTHLHESVTDVRYMQQLFLVHKGNKNSHNGLL